MGAVIEDPGPEVTTWDRDEEPKRLGLATFGAWRDWLNEFRVDDETGMAVTRPRGVCAPVSFNSESNQHGSHKVNNNKKGLPSR